MHAFRKMLVGTVAVAALAPSTALAHDSYHSGGGVPRGQIEASQYTVEITGSNAVARHERTRQWLTADRSHTVTRTIPSGELAARRVPLRRREQHADDRQGLEDPAVSQPGSGDPQLPAVGRPGLLQADGQHDVQRPSRRRLRAGPRHERPVPRRCRRRPDDRRQGQRNDPAAHRRRVRRLLHAGRDARVAPDAAAEPVHAQAPGDEAPSRRQDRAREARRRLVLTRPRTNGWVAGIAPRPARLLPPQYEGTGGLVAGRAVYAACCRCRGAPRRLRARRFGAQLQPDDVRGST
jgi:hypothetical protein